ncbi:hypothetical protein Bca101_014779 [Brassica carinata]
MKIDQRNQCPHEQKGKTTMVSFGGAKFSGGLISLKGARKDPKVRYILIDIITYLLEAVRKPSVAGNKYSRNEAFCRWLITLGKRSSQYLGLPCKKSAPGAQLSLPKLQLSVIPRHEDGLFSSQIVLLRMSIFLLGIDLRDGL